MKRLYRSRKNRIIGGVCGGIGEYLDIDPVIIRIAWVIMIVFGGFGLLAYIIAWVVIPDEKSKTSMIDDAINKNKKSKKTEENSQMLVALFLIFLGLMFLLNNFGWLSWTWGYTWPAILILLGVVIILSRKN